MAKITYSAVDRTELEKSLIEKKDTKYVVLYPTYEMLCDSQDADANEAVDFSAGSTFIVPTPNDTSGVCTNIFGVLAEAECLPRYFSFRAILASAASYCRSKKISVIIIPAAMLNEVLDENIDRDMLNSAINEIMVGTNIDAIVTPNATEDDHTALQHLQPAKEAFAQTKRENAQVEEFQKIQKKGKKSKKDKKKSKKDKKKGKKNKG